MNMWYKKGLKTTLIIIMCIMTLLSAVGCKQQKDNRQFPV